MEHLNPSDFTIAIEQFEHLLHQYSDPAIAYPVPYEKRRPKRIEAYYPLKPHPIYGITALHAVETYNEQGYIKRYNYEWFIMYPRMGISSKHITSWGNDPHDDPDTPPELRVQTEPHHQHHIPFHRAARRDNYTVRNLQDAFVAIEPYLLQGLPYT
ncbi:hypothetical protein [Paenibacillus sp. WLX2291]|uniref:hypothetical protein n=1 Tax=Paenibacillus sp. WLX2291 TaxID=3296934 RepID=UPI0039842C4E